MKTLKQLENYKYTHAILANISFFSFLGSNITGIVMLEALFNNHKSEYYKTVMITHNVFSTIALTFYIPQAAISFVSYGIKKKNNIPMIKSHIVSSILLTVLYAIMVINIIPSAIVGLAPYLHIDIPDRGDYLKGLAISHTITSLLMYTTFTITFLTVILDKRSK